MVAETIDATAARTVTFTVTGGLPSGATLHVWASNFRSDNLADYFVRQADVTPSGGAFTLTLQPGYVYSFTTTSGQGKATTASPPQASLGAAVRGLVRRGRRRPRTDATWRSSRARSRRSRAAAAAVRPVRAADGTGRHRSPGTRVANPYTLLGNLGWTDYTVAVDALFEQAGSVQVMGRVGTQRGLQRLRHQRLLPPGVQHRRVVDRAQHQRRYADHARLG